MGNDVRARTLSAPTGRGTRDAKAQRVTGAARSRCRLCASGSAEAIRIFVSARVFGIVRFCFGIREVAEVRGPIFRFQRARTYDVCPDGNITNDVTWLRVLAYTVY